MAEYRITFDKVNFSAQVNDLLYYVDDAQTEPALVGRIHSIVDQINFVALRVRDEFNVANQDYEDHVVPANSTALDGTSITTITVPPGETVSYLTLIDQNNPSLGTKQVDVEYIPTFEENTSAPDPTTFVNPFFMFLKNELANVSNVKGYYAKAKMETGATNKVELFAVGSEISLSSK
tara:strand:- start:123 stop:656 length:534 start_codon:yes stop_codon:yes gene_type:complete